MSAAKWWEAPLVAFDVESTGVDVFADRIVTAAVVDITPGRRPMTTTWLINPGVPIPDEATAIHGITTEHARAAGTDPAQALFEITGRLALALTQRVPIVAYNAPFDLSMLEAENHRHQLPGLAHRLAPQPVGPIIDPFIMDRGLDPYRKGKRTLDANCTHYGVTLAGAHTSDADAIAACRLAVVLAKGHAGVRAMGLDRLHNAQIKWHRERQESFADYLHKKGEDASQVNCDWPLRTRTPVQETVPA